MTGRWRGTARLYQNWYWDFNLTQTVGTITGDFVDNVYGPGRLDPAEPGTIDLNGNIAMRTKLDPFGDVYFRGQMDQSGRRIPGTLSGQSLVITSQPWVLNKIN
jgi:hypothetical protein